MTLISLFNSYNNYNSHLSTPKLGKKLGILYSNYVVQFVVKFFQHLISFKNVFIWSLRSFTYISAYWIYKVIVSLQTDIFPINFLIKRF